MVKELGKEAGLEELKAQIAELAARLALLEKGRLENSRLDSGQLGKGDSVEVAEAPESASASMTEDEMLAVSAAIAAYLGVRAHIRQIRLVSTSAWAQQGRVSIQASHSLMTQ